MDAIYFILLIVAFANLSLAILVLWRRSNVEVNRVFALTAAAAAGWAMTNALFLQTDSLDAAMLWARLSYLNAVVLGASFLHFSWVFPLPRFFAHHLRLPLWIASAAVGLLPWINGFVIASVELSDKRSIQTADGVYVIAAFMVVTSAIAFGTFAWHHSELRRIAREQSRYVLTGAFLTAIIGLTCNLFLPLQGNYSLVWMGPLSSLFFVGFSVYAIIAHRLFDIRIIIKRTLIYSFLLTAIGAGYTVAEHLLTEIFEQATQGSQYSWMAGLVGAVTVSIFAAPLRRWLEQFVNTLIYHEHTEKRPQSKKPRETTQ